MKKCIKKLAFAGAAALTAAGLSYAATRLMVKVAFDRELPEVTKIASGRISGSDKDPEFEAARNSAAEALENAPHEKIEIWQKISFHIKNRLFLF